MRKAILATLCLLLCATAVLAETPMGESVRPLALKELTEWRDLMWETWLTLSPLELYEDGDGNYRLTYIFGTAVSTEPILDTPMNPLLGLTLTTDAYTDPRGLSVGMSADEVLAAYPLENPALRGDAHYAALYAYTEEDMDEMDTLGWAWALRNQDALETLQYNVAQCQADGTYVDAGIAYGLEDGIIVSIHLYGFERTVTGEEVRSDIKSIQSLMTRTSYTPGEAMQGPTRFDADDLSFAGFHFDKSTPEAILSLFGEPLLDEEMLDEQGQTRIITYPDALFEFEMGTYGETSLRSVLVQMRTLAGPRELQVGDTLGNVLGLFYREDTGEDADVIALYGDGETPPFGLLTFQAGGGMTVRYGFSKEDEAGNALHYLLRLSFQHEILTEYVLYRDD